MNWRVLFDYLLDSHLPNPCSPPRFRSRCATLKCYTLHNALCANRVSHFNPFHTFTYKPPTSHRQVTDENTVNALTRLCLCFLYAPPLRLRWLPQNFFERVRTFQSLAFGSFVIWTPTVMDAHKKNSKFFSESNFFIFFSFFIFHFG